MSQNGDPPPKAPLAGNPLLLRVARDRALAGKEPLPAPSPSEAEAIPAKLSRSSDLSAPALLPRENRLRTPLSRRQTSVDRTPHDSSTGQQSQASQSPGNREPLSPKPSPAAEQRVNKRRRRKTSSTADPEPKVQRQRIRPESRQQMFERLTNPLISLHEASVLLRVCPATVRRYSDNGVLTTYRTEGRQRRFRLKDVLNLMRQLEAQGK